MIQYVKTSRKLLAVFESFEVIQILREENNHVDALASLGLAYGIMIKRMITFVYLDECEVERDGEKCGRIKSGGLKVMDENSFAAEDLSQTYNKNYMNRHVVLFL